MLSLKTRFRRRLRLGGRPCIRSPGNREAEFDRGKNLVHMKDLQHNQNAWRYVLTGEGDFPWLDLKRALDRLRYERFISFEWEKKWHPEIADPEIALLHFARWFRENCA
jgi:sugar phosphate isomerase/epimerase